MSSMRNAAPRRPHKERSQPQSRAKWGLLEKHKDYSLRAADYAQKKKKLNILSQKSKERNPDEFAFGMLSADKGRAGKHGSGDTQKNRLDHTVVEGLKKQDAGYLRTMMGRARREIQRVKEEIGLDKAMKNMGVDSENERKVRFGNDNLSLSTREASYDEGRDSDSMIELSEENKAVLDVQRSEESESETNSSKVAAQTKTNKQVRMDADSLARRKAAKQKRRRLREARANKLEILQKRQKSIMAAMDALELQRAKMAKTIGGTNKMGVKFKVRERKR